MNIGRVRRNIAIIAVVWLVGALTIATTIVTVAYHFATKYW